MFTNQLPGGGSIMPQFAKGAYDVTRNYNSGTGKPIESAAMAHLAPQERFNVHTSEAAKLLSNALNSQGVRLSPLQLEYLSNAYFGQLPHTVALLTDSLFENSDVAKPAGHTSDNPFFGRFFQNNRGTDDIEHMYEIATQAKEASDTFKEMAKAGRADDARKFFEEHKQEIAVQKSAAAFTAKMAKLKQAEAAITNAPSMSAEEKQTQLDRLQETRKAIAEAYRKPLSDVLQ